MAPSLSFTCEEAWKARGNITSIHLEDFLITKVEFKNENINTKWNIIKNIRKVITGALEKKRADKIIGSSLETHIKIYVNEDIKNKIEDIAFDEIAITSSFEIMKIHNENSFFSLKEIEDVEIEVIKVNGLKCNRCWKYKDRLNNNDICDRCKDAIK